MLRLLAGCGVLCLAICSLAAPLMADEGDATKVVSRWQAAILETMRNASSLGHEGRIRQLAPVLDETHDLARMAQDSLGKSWEQLTKEQGAAFLGLYRRAMLADLGSSLYRFRQETFKALEEQADEGVVRVKTVQLRGERKTSYDYRLRQAEGGWRIVDVITKGVSEQKRKRAQYQPLIEAKGLPALLARLEDEIRQANETPKQVITRLQDRVLVIWRQGATLGYQGRLEMLAPLIASTHDLTGMAQLAVRRAWKGWSLEQKKRYVKVFRQLSIATYASEFGKYAGETFAFRDEQKVKSSIVIRTTLTKSSGEKNQLDYFLRLVKNRWRVVNLRVDGISELSSKQSSYGKTLSGQGFPALLEQIRSKIRRLESEGQ